MFQVDITRLPLEYWLCALVLVFATAFAVRLRNEAWAPPFIAVLATVGAWYMIEPIYFEDFFSEFTYGAATSAYVCLLVFLASFLLLSPVVVKAFQPKASKGEPTGIGTIHPEEVIPTIVGAWLVLLLIGFYRAEGDVLTALFPIEGRLGGNMWARDAGGDAGPTGFLVSTGAYLYVLLLSVFGLLLPLTKKPTMRTILVICILISWPYAFLQGSRNITLAVVIPGLASYLLIADRPPAMKGFIAVVSFLALDFAMRAIIRFRNVGFDLASYTDVEEARHLGLNMASELIWITGFIQDGVMDITYGLGYLYEMLNIVPRAVWPDKPILGIDYAIARGFGGGQSDIGVFATLSTGIVGQGVLNFGLWFGPFMAALLMACWVGFLGRLRHQGGAPRTALFLIGLGLTFNLGRDITLLVLFPFVFGYIGVRILERRQKRKEMQARIDNRVASLSMHRLPAAGKTPL